MVRRLLVLLAAIVAALALAGGHGLGGRRRLPRGGDPPARQHPPLGRRDARADQGRRRRGGAAAGPRRLPVALRAGRDAAARRRQRPDDQDRVPVRHDPHGDLRRQVGRARSATRSSSCATCSTRRERKLTDAGVGAPALVAGQSFLILFREGFEVVLLLAVLLGYLEAARSPQYIRPILYGVVLAAVATVATVLLMPTIFGLMPVGREVLEAITALARRRRAVLRLVLADRPARAEAVDGVRARPAVERGVGRLHRLADGRRVHRRVPRGLRDGAVLPIAADVRRGPRLVHPPRRRPRLHRPRRRRVGRLQARPQAAGAHVHEHRRGAGDDHLDRPAGQRGAHAAGRRRDHVPAHVRAAPADLPRRGHGHLADRVVAARPGHPGRRSTCSAPSTSSSSAPAWPTARRAGQVQPA